MYVEKLSSTNMLKLNEDVLRIKTCLTPQEFNSDRSNAVSLLWFFFARFSDRIGAVFTSSVYILYLVRLG